MRGKIIVARVTAFEIPGLTIWFWSNDHEPPHFHVKRRGEWEIKVHFLMDASSMVEIVRGTPSRKDLKQIVLLSEQHRRELLEQWQNLRESEQAE
ncbi:MAG: DUF4160 domain-containing protein [Planctomycetes bacterium]|nr:DUF4160 domain-containing protein [Planctomycetota bacterium]